MVVKRFCTEDLICGGKEVLYGRSAMWWQRGFVRKICYVVVKRFCTEDLLCGGKEVLYGRSAMWW